MRKIKHTEPVPLNLRTATSKRSWTWLMAVYGARYFPTVWGKPIAPTLKRWRRLRKLLITEARNAQA